MKVLITQPIFPHYRESLFNLMANDKNIEFKIVAGRNLHGVKEFESTTEKIAPILVNKRLDLKGHSFFYQKGIFRVLKEFKPTNVILSGPDYHFLSTIIVAFYLLLFTKIEVHFWTHGLSKSKSRIIFIITRYLFSKAKSIYTYEQAGKDLIIERMGISRDKIIVVKNSLNEKDYGFNKGIEKRQDGKELKLLFSGRLTYNKRVDLLIKAISILHKKKIPVKCTIIGSGDYMKQLEILTIELGLTDIIDFKGALYGEGVETYFQSSDAFVLPGKVGLSIIHALSYGIPVITTSKPIHSPEFAILKNKYNAFLFDTFTDQGLANTLEQFYQKNLETDYADNCIKSIYDNGYIPQMMKDCFIKGLIIS